MTDDRFRVLSEHVILTFPGHYLWATLLTVEGKTMFAQDKKVGLRNINTKMNRNESGW